jgi:predicted lipoprotein with Yx(FWY)xxD motif
MGHGRIKLFAVGSFLLVGLAACSNDSTPSPAQPAQGSSPPSTAPTGSSSGEPTVDVVVGTADTDIGTVLTNDEGYTLYLLETDPAGKSTCDGSCAPTWPPLAATGTVKADKGVRQEDIATIKRSDGSTQVTYYDHPLYVYSGDQSPGDTNGEGVSDVWYAISPAGDKVQESGGTKAGGGGYGY